MNECGKLTMKGNDNLRNPHEPVKELVKILHKYQIPLSLLDQVLNLVRIDIEQNSIPYNPDGDDKGKDFVLNLDELPQNSHAFLQPQKENAAIKRQLEKQREDDPKNEDVIVSYRTKRACINCDNYFTHCKDCKYGSTPRQRFIDGVQEDGCQIGPV